MTLPVAVVGAGNMGRHHARNYSELKEADLRAIVDPDIERARSLADRYGAEAFIDVGEMLMAIPEVDAASIAVPTSLHSEVAVTLLQAGKHVLVEKPIAPNVEEADRLVALAAERSLVLAVGHVERFNPAVGELKRLIDEGQMGSPLSLIARRVGLMPPQIRDANVIVDLAVHDIDIFCYLLDAEGPDELYCNAGKAIAADRFDFADITLRFGAVSCFLQVNWLTPVKIRSLTVTGTEGYAQLEYVTQKLEYYRAGPAQAEPDSFADLEALSEQNPVVIEFEHAEPLQRELTAFLAAVRGEPAATVTGKEATRSMAIAAQLVDLVDSRAPASS
jgi:UDP-N-acetylglucosamine 3-dehydrogenase